jgi:hypothetical protein
MRKSLWIVPILFPLLLTVTAIPVWSQTPYVFSLTVDNTGALPIFFGANTLTLTTSGGTVTLFSNPFLVGPDSTSSFTTGAIPLPVLAPSDELDYSLNGAAFTSLGGTIPVDAFAVGATIPPTAPSQPPSFQISFLDLLTIGLLSGHPVQFESGDLVSFDAPEAVGTWSLTATETPEPGTAVLWLTGIALMIVMRKRIAQLLPTGHWNAQLTVTPLSGHRFQRRT